MVLPKLLLLYYNCKLKMGLHYKFNLESYKSGKQIIPPIGGII